MSTFTLQPQNHFAAPYNAVWAGPVTYFVESEFPTTSMVLDGNNLAAFRAGQRFQFMGRLENANVHRQTVYIPYRGTWFLVIVNYGTVPTAVHFAV